MHDHRRHVIDETADITSALDSARRTWPELTDQPGELLRQLVITGQRALDDAARSRRHAIESTSGTLAGSFPTRYLDELRDDWPD
jgi:hypothetical protein